MFGIGRRKSHRDLVRAELSEGIDHFVQAASHAAGGVGATMGPRVDAAREYVGPAAARVRGGAQRRWGSTMATLAPLAVAAADSARQAGSAAKKGKVTEVRRNKKKASGRLSKLTGALAIGALVGAAGAVAMRRRRETQEWNSYDPAASLTGIEPGSTEAMSATPAMPETGPAVQEKTPAADKAASATTSITESAKQTAGKTTASAKEAAGKATGKAETLVDNTTSAARNSHH